MAPCLRLGLILLPAPAHKACLWTLGGGCVGGNETEEQLTQAENRHPCAWVPNLVTCQTCPVTGQTFKWLPVNLLTWRDFLNMVEHLGMKQVHGWRPGHVVVLSFSSAEGKPCCVGPEGNSCNLCHCWDWVSPMLLISRAGYYTISKVSFDNSLPPLWRAKSSGMLCGC